MNNLFKKGFASLALASAMVSSVFAGNAAYIDVKVNYLSGTGKAVLGYQDDTKNLEKVELLVSVLDADGEYATKNKDGSDVVGTVELSGEADSTATKREGIISRDLQSGENINRFVLDYTNAIVSKLENEITFTLDTGVNAIERKITIALDTVDAKGLIVRATPNGKIKTEKYINQAFTDINVTGGVSELNNTSSKAPGGLVGVSIPIQVYASSMANNSSVEGNFTFAPNLEGKTIVVQALADYSDSNTTEMVLNSIELVMSNGQATGNIVITTGLPAGVDSSDGDFNVTPDNLSHFESALSDGLAIAFLVYVKDKQSINNYHTTIADTTNLTTISFDVNITDWGNSTDTIRVKSGEPAMLKVGTIDRDATKLSKLWTKTSSILTIVDGNETTTTKDGDITDITSLHKTTTKLTVVDSYGNPASVNTGLISSVKFGSKKTSDVVKASTVGVTGGFAVDGISTIVVTVEDSEDTNNTTIVKSVNFTVDASNGMLAALDHVALTVRTLPLREVSKDGGARWKKAITDINTSDDFVDTANFPLVSTATNVIKVTENDFTLVIKSGIDDSDLSDGNSTFRVYIVDKSGDEEYLQGSDLTSYAIDVDISKNATVTVKETKASDGYILVDYNTTEGQAVAEDVDFNITITNNSKLLAKIIVDDYDAKDNEEEVTINIPTYEDKKINAFVTVYAENEDLDITEAKPGTIINFKFTGAAVNVGDEVIIDMNSTGFSIEANGKENTEGRIGLVGSTISDNTDGSITTILPENGIVSVVLYDANKTDKGFYGFDTDEITINGAKPIWLYLKDDGDTDTREFVASDNIVMSRLDDNSVIKARVSLTTDGNGDGSADDKRKVLPETESVSNKPLTASGDEVLTGLYYDIFTKVLPTDVVFLDMYDNEVSGLKGDIKKDVTFTATSGIEFDNDGTDSWIKFKDEAAGSEQTLTLTYIKDDGSKVSNTITWTKIKLSAKNSGFVITDNFGGFVDPNTGIFDVVNSEIVVKIIGNGNQKQSSTKITLSHANEDAKFRLVKVDDLATNLYANVLSGLTDSIKTTIDKDGSYYIVSSDTAGVLTITVSSTVKDAKDNDVAISGTHTITFDAIDLNKPMVKESGVVAANGQIITEVVDDNLNTVATTVIITDINDKLIAEAVYVDGKYVAQVSSAGIYQIEIEGVDMAGNVQRFNFTRVLGEGSATLESSLVSYGAYTVAGTFSSHDFADVDSAFDWVYTDAAGTVYQLLGNASSDDDVFGWKEATGVTPAASDWSMVKLTGALSGKFGWVLVNSDGLAYKLSGVNADGTFKFSDRLYVDGDITGSTVTFTAK